MVEGFRLESCTVRSFSKCCLLGDKQQSERIHRRRKYVESGRTRETVGLVRQNQRAVAANHIFSAAATSHIINL